MLSGGVLYNNTCYTLNSTSPVEYESILRLVNQTVAIGDDGVLENITATTAAVVNKTRSPSDEYFQ